MITAPEKNKDEGMEPFSFTFLENKRPQPFVVAEAIRQNVYSRRGVTKSEVLLWMKRLLVWHGFSETESAIFAMTIIDALIAVGDVGIGRAFGQLMLVPTRERNVLLPTGEIARIGGTAIESIQSLSSQSLVRKSLFNHSDLEAYTAILGTPQFLDYAAENTVFRFSQLANLKANDKFDSDLSDWIDFATRHARFDHQSVYQLDEGTPLQLKRAIMLLGTLDYDKGGWCIDKITANALNEWLELPEERLEDTGQEPVPDRDQITVIEADPQERLIVEAGPGSGKTLVACQRIAHLILNNVAAPRIWLLSFTRVAVEEIRQRIVVSLKDSSAARSINVATFDSFAWQLNSRFESGDNSSVRTFEQSIADAVGLLRSEDMALSDFMGTLEHVVIDEAQDLVGNRHTMVDLFLSNLPDHCGVTVLGDFAQAIYGWQEQSEENSTRSVKASLLTERQGFNSVRLQTDHRTKNPNLAQLFVSARQALRDEQRTPRERYDNVRTLIEDASDHKVNGINAPRFPTGNNSMVLFRGRGPLLATGHALARQQRTFRIKLSNRQETVSPWIGALLAGADEQARLTRNDVSVLFRDLQSFSEELDEETIWNALLEVSESQMTTISVSSIAQRIERGLPIKYTSRTIGASGPTLSTIHGAKGQEADRVLLMLPGRPYEDDEDIDWDEQARILFVGATRARKELFIGSRRTGLILRAKSGRSWRGRSDNFSAEIGLPGDVSMLANEIGGLPELEWLRTTSLKLLGFRDQPVHAIASRDSLTGRYAVFALPRKKGDDNPVCYLSDSLVGDIASIAESDLSALPDKLDGFSILGCTTHVWQANDTVAGAKGVAVAPILAGFAQVSIGGS